LPPLGCLWDGGAISQTAANPVTPDLGQATGITIFNASIGVTSFGGDAQGTYVFMQEILGGGTDGASTAVINGSFTAGSVNATVNVNTVQKGLAAITAPCLAVCVWTTTLTGWSVTLQYPSAAGAVYGNDAKWRRSWLFRMASFAVPKPKKIEEDIAQRVMKMMAEAAAAKDEKVAVPALQRGTYVIVDETDEKSLPPRVPLRVRTPGKVGGPCAERPPTPKESVAALLSEINNQNERKQRELDKSAASAAVKALSLYKTEQLIPMSVIETTGGHKCPCHEMSSMGCCVGCEEDPTSCVLCWSLKWF